MENKCAGVQNSKNKQTSSNRKKRLLFCEFSVANTFVQKLIGMLLYSSITEEKAILLLQCNSIHTYGMRFPIDVVFIDKDGIVVSKHENMKPCRYATNRQAIHTLEIKSGLIRFHNIQIGNTLAWDDSGVYAVP